jgi:hypothetical protein
MRRSVLSLTLVGCACAGCGSSGPKGPVQLAADASEHVQLAGTLVSPIANVSANGAGDFHNDPDGGQLAVSFRAGSTSGTLSIVVAGRTLYASSPLYADSLPGNGWASFNLSKLGKRATAAFGAFATQTPAGVFHELRHSRGVTTVGPAAVAGQAATHYRVTASSAGYRPVDVWVGNDGLILQVAASYTSSSGETAVTLVFSGYGAAVTAASPPSGDSLDLTDDAVKTLKGRGAVSQ